MALVGGSRPQEGNIMVNGQPVCDDGTEEYRAATAAVVCRFIHVSNDAVQLTILKFTNFRPIILLPCLFMKFLFLFVLIAYSLPQSQIFFKGAWIRWSESTHDTIVLRVRLGRICNG